MEYWILPPLVMVLLYWLVKRLIWWFLDAWEGPAPDPKAEPPKRWPDYLGQVVDPTIDAVEKGWRALRSEKDSGSKLAGANSQKMNVAEVHSGTKGIEDPTMRRKHHLSSSLGTKIVSYCEVDTWLEKARHDPLLGVLNFAISAADDQRVSATLAQLPIGPNEEWRGRLTIGWMPDDALTAFPCLLLAMGNDRQSAAVLFRWRQVHEWSAQKQHFLAFTQPIWADNSDFVTFQEVMICKVGDQRGYIFEGGAYPDGAFKPVLNALNGVVTDRTFSSGASGPVFPVYKGGFLNFPTGGGWLKVR